MNRQIGDVQSPAEIIGNDKAHVWHHIIQHKPMQTTGEPMVLSEGKGLRVWDVNGKEYLVAVSGGVWTVNVGYGRESIANAVRDQLVKMCYFSNAAGNVPGAQFAERLIDKMPGLSRVYYSNSGSEANEKGFKLVRQLAALKITGKSTRLYFAIETIMALRSRR